MEVLGQFNLGFIFVKLDNDLFIIDQHASDEKFKIKKVVLHMAGIRHPWNSPHGRFTMKYLNNLNMLPASSWIEN